jgi:hypothetical protein
VLGQSYSILATPAQPDTAGLGQARACMHPVDVAVYKKEEPRSCRALMAPMHGPARAAAKQSFPADQPCDHAVPFPACCCSFQDAPPRDSDESGDEEPPKSRSSAGGTTPPSSRPSKSLLPPHTRTKEDLLKAALATVLCPQRKRFRTQESYARALYVHNYVCKKQLASYDEHRWACAAGCCWSCE